MKLTPSTSSSSLSSSTTLKASMDSADTPFTRARGAVGTVLDVGSIEEAGRRTGVGVSGTRTAGPEVDELVDEGADCLMVRRMYEGFVGVETGDGVGIGPAAAGGAVMARAGRGGKGVGWADEVVAGVDGAIDAGVEGREATPGTAVGSRTP